MRTTTDAAHASHSSLVSKEERGQRIKRRRLALGIAGHSEFEEAMGNRFDRSTLKRAELGGASDNTYDLIESWLDRAEQENGHTAEESESPAEFIRIEVHGYYGASQIIFKAPVDRPDEAAEMIRKVMEGIRAQGVPDPE